MSVNGRSKSRRVAFIGDMRPSIVISNSVEINFLSLITQLYSSLQNSRPCHDRCWQRSLWSLELFAREERSFADMGGVAIKADIHPSLARPSGRSQMSGSIVILTGAGTTQAMDKYNEHLVNIIEGRSIRGWRQSFKLDPPITKFNSFENKARSTSV